MFFKHKTKGLSEEQIALLIATDCESKQEAIEAVNDLCPCGPGGVGHAMRQRKQNLWRLIDGARSQINART